jgi:hypothetical protein
MVIHITAAPEELFNIPVSREVAPWAGTNPLKATGTVRIKSDLKMASDPSFPLEIK